MVMYHQQSHLLLGFFWQSTALRWLTLSEWDERRREQIRRFYDDSACSCCCNHLWLLKAADEDWQQNLAGHRRASWVLFFLHVPTWRQNLQMQISSEMFRLEEFVPPDNSQLPLLIAVLWPWTEFCLIPNIYTQYLSAYRDCNWL